MIFLLDMKLVAVNFVNLLGSLLLIVGIIRQAMADSLTWCDGFNNNNLLAQESLSSNLSFSSKWFLNRKETSNSQWETNIPVSSEMFEQGQMCLFCNDTSSKLLMLDTILLHSDFQANFDFSLRWSTKSCDESLSMKDVKLGVAIGDIGNFFTNGPDSMRIIQQDIGYHLTLIEGNLTFFYWRPNRTMAQIEDSKNVLDLRNKRVNFQRPSCDGKMAWADYRLKLRIENGNRAWIDFCYPFNDYCQTLVGSLGLASDLTALYAIRNITMAFSLLGPVDPKSSVQVNLTSIYLYDCTPRAKTNMSVLMLSKELPSQILHSFMPTTIDRRVPKDSVANSLLKDCEPIKPENFAPSSPDGGTVFCKPYMAVDSFLGLDTVEEKISVSATLMLSWMVATCELRTFQRDRPIRILPTEQVFIGSVNQVWTPKFAYINTPQSVIYMHDTDQFREDMLAFVNNQEAFPFRNFSFFWLKLGIFESKCFLNLAKFPFDSHECSFAFSLLLSNALVSFEEPHFFWPERRDDDNKAEWSPANISASLGATLYGNKPTSSVYFKIKLARNPIYYLMNLVLPCCMLVACELGTFILPPQHPDRPAISVTMLLALAISQTMVMNYVPKTPQRILLADYVTWLTGICAFCALYQMAACWYAESLLENGNKRKRCLIKPRMLDMIVFSAVIIMIVAVNIYAVSIILAA